MRIFQFFSPSIVPDSKEKHSKSNVSNGNTNDAYYDSEELNNADPLYYLNNDNSLDYLNNAEFPDYSDNDDPLDYLDDDPLDYLYKSKPAKSSRNAKQANSINRSKRTITSSAHKTSNTLDGINPDKELDATNSDNESSDSQLSDSKLSDSQLSDSNSTDSQLSDSKSTDSQSTDSRSAKSRKHWKFSKSSIIPAILLLASFASLIYPHAAMWISQYHMSEVAAEYAKLITHAVPAPHEQLKRAREYNRKLSSGAIYEANTNIPTSHGATSDASQDYWDQLKVNDDGLMARLRIKKIDLDLPVYHGTEDATLLKGLGHLRGTSLPVGGSGTRSVITGHRGLASAEMFTRLDEIVKGDTFTIEVFDEILTYRVIDKIVVNPDETKKIAAVPGKDLVTLITCTPLGINTQRILITGEHIIPTPTSDKALRGKKPDVPRFPWWIVWSVASLCIVCGYIWWAGLPVKKKKRSPYKRVGRRIAFNK